MSDDITHRASVTGSIEMLNRRSHRDRADAAHRHRACALAQWRVCPYSSLCNSRPVGPWCAEAIVAAARPLGGQLPREVRPYTILGVSFCAWRATQHDNPHV